MNINQNDFGAEQQTTVSLANSTTGQTVYNATFTDVGSYDFNSILAGSSMSGQNDYELTVTSSLFFNDPDLFPEDEQFVGNLDFGATLSLTVTAAIPEPGVISMFLFANSCLLLRRRRN